MADEVFHQAKQYPGKLIDWRSGPRLTAGKLVLQAFSAGVGNWVADEILYQAKLYPEVKANSLTEDEIKELHKAVKYVPEAAVEAEADSEKFPPGLYSMLLHLCCSSCTLDWVTISSCCMLTSCVRPSLCVRVHWSCAHIWAALAGPLAVWLHTNQF